MVSATWPCLAPGASPVVGALVAGAVAVLLVSFITFRYFGRPRGADDGSADFYDGVRGSSRRLRKDDVQFLIESRHQRLLTDDRLADAAHELERARRGSRTTDELEAELSPEPEWKI